MLEPRYLVSAEGILWLLETACFWPLVWFWDLERCFSFRDQVLSPLLLLPITYLASAAPCAHTPDVYSGKRRRGISWDTGLHPRETKPSVEKGELWGASTFSLSRTTRFASFPDYLVIQIKKFTFGLDWVPKKLGMLFGMGVVIQKVLEKKIVLTCIN